MQYESELYHHGIKGQRWGVRRFEDSSGHLTSAGKARYDKYKEYSSMKKKASMSADPSHIRATKAFKKENAKEIRQGKKIAQNRAIDEKMTRYYKKEGLSNEEAAQKAKTARRVCTGIAVAAGLAGAAIVGHKVYQRIGQEYFDSTIKSGIRLDRISGNDKPDDFQRAFYAVTSKGDRSKYVGLYGKSIKDGSLLSSNNPVYKHTGSTTSAIRVASNKNAKNVFNKLYSTDPEFRKSADAMIKNAKDNAATPKQMMAVQRNKYNAFNFSLYKHDESTEPAQKKFYEALNKKGYGAIHDMNDNKWSGYNAQSAHIVFDGKKIGKESVQRVASQKVDNSYNKEQGKIILRQNAPLLAMTGWGTVAYAEAARHESKVQKAKQNKKKQK